MKNTTKPAQSVTADTYTSYARAERVSCVGSTSVTQIAFDSESGNVFVTWKESGKTYCWEGVGAEEWERFKTADSKGKFANQIKAGTYICRGPLL